MRQNSPAPTLQQMNPSLRTPLFPKGSDLRFQQLLSEGVFCFFRGNWGSGGMKLVAKQMKTESTVTVS